MPQIVEQQVQNVLQAMSQVLGFASSCLFRLDTDRGGLVISFALGSRLPFLRQAEQLLGFDLTGAVMPLWAEESLIVRCYREGRILTTVDLDEVTRGALPPNALGDIQSSVGLRFIVCVPVPGASGTMLAVALLDREDTSPLTPDERDQLLLYADRLGQLLESDRLGAPLVSPDEDSPVARWLSVHLLDRSLEPVWSGGAGPAAPAVVAAFEHRLKPGPAEITLADGSVVLVHVYFVDPQGQVMWLLLCEDLARRDREARELREQVRLLLARVQEAVVSVDADLRVTGCNDAVRAVFGWEPAEMIGQHVTTSLPSGAVKATHRRLASALLKAGHVERQLQLQRRDGATFPADMSVLLLAHEGGAGPAGAIATVRDLSEQRRQAAERLRLRKKLLRSERLAALGQMAARIAHEVRNPLAAIGAAALAVEEDETTSVDVQERAGAIGSEVRRLDAILTDLLRFAKPPKASRMPVKLEDLVAAAVTFVQADPASSKVSHRIEIQERGLAEVQADPGGLRQVMVNLLRNAIEACEGEGKVTTRVKRAGPMMKVQVSDTGTGVARSARRRVFEPFFSTKSRGTGLGLPISRAIVEEHGGRLRLQARRGGGTMATVELPIGMAPTGRFAGKE